MRKTFRMTAAVLMATLLATSFTGCGKAEDAKKDAGTGKEVVENQDPFGKYEEPVSISVIRRDFGDPIPTGEDAPWTQKYKEYGINVEVAWSADSSQLESKLNTAIASGDIPDMFQVVGAEQMNTLARADMLYDMTDAFETYASPLVKERFSTSAGKAALESATYDGKLLFIPVNVTENLNNMEALYIRKDWLDNLGLEIPKTMDDLKEIAIAFTKNDPDQNGKDDTYGLAMDKEMFGNITTFFTGFGVYPGAWYDGMIFYSEDENGGLTWDGEKPGVKEGLAMLQELYKEGAIRQDFAVYDNTRKAEDLNGGKAGLAIGARGYPAWLVHNTYVNNPEAEWYGMQMPGKDEGTESILLSYQPLNSGFAVSKECENPEAVIKMLNLVTEISEPSSEMYDPKYLSSNRTETGDSYIYGIEDPELERKSSQSIFKAFESKDPSALSAADKKIYDNILLFEDTKDASAWSDWNRFYPAPGHVYYEIYEMNKDTELKENAWQRLPSQNMSSKLAIWEKMINEAFVKIVSGENVDEWDKVVADWNKLGGDDITKEVQENAGK